MTNFETTFRWGLLPIALAVAVPTMLRLGAVTSRAPFGRHAALRGAVLLLAAIVLAVRILGHAGVLGRWALFAALLVLAAVVFVVRRDVSLKIGWRELLSLETTPLVAVSLGALGLVGIAAWLLPVWQWDSLGYHLPYVDFALQNGSLRDLPPDLPYLSSYPHVVEEFFTAWRAMLPDDRLVDLAQIPFGLLGSLAIAVIARDLGARKDHALAAGLAWLTLPATFLQLPTNYIDVGTASLLLAAGAFALAPSTPENIVGAGVALGLFLGSKPNAPLGTALVGGLVLVRSLREKQRVPLAAAVVVCLVLGVESYIANLVRHHNPIWPVTVTVGPIELSGLLPMKAVLAAGCSAPRVHGILPVRLLRSWTSFGAPPIFDMRFGGFETLFLVALPVAVYVAWKKRSLPLAVVAVAALASPDPAVPRYVLAFPGLVLAVASSQLDRLPKLPRRLLVGALAIAAGIAVARVRPGLAGDGPPLSDYLHMDEHARLRAVAANGPADPYYDALDRLEPGDVNVFDGSLDLYYLAWRPDLANKARWLESPASGEEAARLLADPKVRLLMVDDRSAIAGAARTDPRFEELYHCPPRLPPKCLEPDTFASSSDKDAPLVKSLTETSSCVILFRR